MKKYTLVLFILIFSFGLFIFNVAPSKASAYTCIATILTPTVELGKTAKVSVNISDISNASGPVYVFASPLTYGTSQASTAGSVGQSIECSAASCTLEFPYTSVAVPGSVIVDALTYPTTVLGDHSFNIFCSTNKPLGRDSQGILNDAREVSNVTAIYTVISGGQDCELTGPDQLLIPQTFNGGTVPPNYSFDKSGTKTFTLKNSGSVSANLAISSSTAGVTASLGATTLAGGATVSMTIKSGTASRETFTLTSSCGVSTHTYPLVGEVFVPGTPKTCQEKSALNYNIGWPCKYPLGARPACSPGDYPIVVAGGPITITEGQTIIRDMVVNNPYNRAENIKIFAARENLPRGVHVTFSPAEGIISTGMSFQTKATFKADGLVLAGKYQSELGVSCLGGGVGTKLSITTQNKVIPTKDAASMPATINTLRTSETKMLNLRLESAGTPQTNSWGTLRGRDFMSVKSWTNPVMILDSRQFNFFIGARYFSLADPMDPKSDGSNNLELNHIPAGDNGGHMNSYSISYSRDGKYEISNQWNNGTFGSTPEYRVNGGETEEEAGIYFWGHGERNPVDIFQSNSHVYFTKLNSGGIYRLDGVTKSAPYLNSLGGLTEDWVYPELPDTAPNIPNATDTMGVNTTVMAGAKDYVAVLTGPASGWALTTPNKLSIYGTGDSPAVAEIAVNNLPANAQYLSGLTSFVTSDVQYVMFMVTLPQLPVSPTLTTFDPRRSQILLYVYKFDPATNALTKIAEGLKFAGEPMASIAGIRVGNKDGVMMLLNDDLTKYDQNLNPAHTPSPLYKPVIYMFSDLSAGRFKDVFQDAGYGSNTTIASLNVGVSTYVYLNNPGDDILNPSYGISVLKFDPSGVNVGGNSSPVAICQDSTSLNYGGTLPCRYPPTPRPACSPGDLFNTDTGLPCGTGRKLRCVNLSSNFYCSYTSDTPVTAVTPTPLPPTPLPPTPTPPSVASSCTLSGSISKFEPNPPGVKRPESLNAFLSIGGFYPYQPPGSSPRLLVTELFGYQVVDISIRGNPQALVFEDYRLSPTYPGPIPCFGDCHGSLGVMAVSADGVRVMFGLSDLGASSSQYNGALIGQPNGYGFALSGYMVPRSPRAMLIQQVGPRYVAYTFADDGVRVADVTTLPGLSLDTIFGGSGEPLASTLTSLPIGEQATLSGYWITYTNGSSIIYLVNASSPLPATGLTAKQFTVAAFGHSSDRLMSLSAAQDPANPAAVYLLGEFASGSQYPFTPTGYTLIRVLGGVPTIVGSLRPGTGETDTGATSLAADNAGNLFAFMWTRTSAGVYRQYTSSVQTFGTSSSFFDVTTPGFVSGMPALVAGTGAGQIYAYVPSGTSGWVIPMTCGTSTTPNPPPPPPPVIPPVVPPPPPPPPPSCPTGASLGLPACVNGCYVPQGGPGGGNPSDYYKCVPNGSFQFTLLLKLGSTGSEVTALQNFLNAAGYDCGTADGNFGPKTEAAVIKFQIANGLVGDGIVGALTRAVLNK